MLLKYSIYHFCTCYYFCSISYN